MNRKRWIVRIISCLLIIVGIILFFNDNFITMIVKNNTHQYRLTKVSSKQINQNKKTQKGNFDFNNSSTISVSQVMNAKFSQEDLAEIGYIIIPDLKLYLPIFYGTGGNTMLYGAGTMKPNQIMGEGNYALASHHVFGNQSAEELLFSPLEKAKNGMTIYITDKTMIYSYNITNVFQVTPEHVEVINDIPGKKEVTLVTCTDAQATNRIIVKGNLIKKEKWSHKSKVEKTKFETKKE